MRFLCSMAEKCSAVVAAKLRPKVLVIAGSTSVGKTDLSVELARQLNGEIISADSVQMFRGMDIGSAKITAEEAGQIPHHFIDVVDITQSFSAGQFAEYALKVIPEIVSRGRVPMVVGGTGLYIRMMMEGPSGAPTSTPQTKAMIEDMVKQDKGEWGVSLERLKSHDPEYASKLLPNDWFRLKRALEICTLTGRTVTSFKREYCDGDSEFDFKCLFLTMPRIPLKQRIDARCEVIVERGLFTEVIRLVKGCGLVADCQAGRTVGYRQALEFLEAVWGFPSHGPPYQLQVPREQLRKLFLEFLYNYQAKTRMLANDQMTRFKTSPHFHWLNVAPGGVRLPQDVLAGAVGEWFTQDTPLPQEWSGEELKNITKEEQQELKRYDVKHRRLNIYCDLHKVDTVLTEIETAIRGTSEPADQS